MTYPNSINLSWYANHAHKEIQIGPEGHGEDVTEELGGQAWEELGPVTIERDILEYWDSRAFRYPVQLLEEGQLVANHFKLTHYRLNYESPY